MILPEGYELEFLNPTGHPDVFKNLIEYIDKEINMILCGENEAGQAEQGSRASSQVANTVRVVKASEISEMLCQNFNQSLVRWIVDLNFGMDVATPTLTREFRIEESSLTVPDVSLLIQSGYTPKKEWLERHFRVELDEKKDSSEQAGDETTYDPQQDQDLYGSIFGDGANGEAPPVEGGGEAAPQPQSTEEPPVEGETETAPSPQPAEEPSGEPTEGPDPYDEVFGNEKITEDEAVSLSDLYNDEDEG